MLQGDEVALGGRVEQEAVGRGSLAIGDRVGVGRRQQDAAQHLVFVDRDRAVELAVGGVVEEVESALLGGRIVGILVEDLVVEPRLRPRRRLPCRPGGAAMAPASGMPMAFELSTKFVISWAVMMPSWLMLMYCQSWWAVR